MTLFDDGRAAARSLATHRTESALIVLILALAIGANTAIFSVVEVVLWRVLPVQDPEQLVRVFSSDGRGGAMPGRTSYPIYLEYRDRVSTLSGLAAFRDSLQVDLALGSGTPEPVGASLVSGNFFEVLGVGAWVGRVFTPGDDVRQGAHPLAVVGHRLWEQRLGASPQAVGSTLRVNGHTFTVIGVAPPQFAGVGLEDVPELFLPIAMGGEAEPVLQGQMQHASNPFFDVVGRLAPKRTIADSRAELDSIGRALGAGQRVFEAGEGDWLRPWPHLRPAAAVVGGVGGQAARLSRLLSGVVVLLLVIACVDVLAVMLARAERRRKETALRLALGSSRARIVRVFLVEGLLLSSAGAALGLGLALVLAPRFLPLIPTEVPLPIAAASSPAAPRVLAFTVLAALLAGAAFSLLPALQASRISLLGGLKSEVARARHSGLSFRGALVMGQVAASTTLLVGSLLLLRSLREATTVDPGFDQNGVLVASVNLARAGYSKQTGAAFLEPLQQRLAAMPGVRAAAISSRLPLQPASTTTIRVDGRPKIVPFSLVSPEYASTLGLPILRGRDLDWQDVAGRSGVGLVNEALAERFWPGRDPIGQRLDGFSPLRASIEIVGVVRARGGTAREPASPLLLLPLAQFYHAFPWQPRTFLVVRAADVRAVAAAIPKAVQTLDEDLPVLGLRTARAEMGLAFAQERLLAILFSAFAGLAVLLSAAGLYGVIASSTESRMREFGVRTAVGARAGQIAGLVLRQSLGLLGVGLAVGVIIAGAGGRMIASYLFGVTSTDAPSFLGAIGVLTLATLVAVLGPLRRAAAADPNALLRSE